MQGIEEKPKSISGWNLNDEKTALKVGSLVLCFIGFLGFSIMINAIPDLNYEYYSKNFRALDELFAGCPGIPLGTLLGVSGIFAAIGGILCVIGLACHKDAKNYEVIKTVIYSIALAAIGLFLGMAITGSMMHTEAWYELKKIEPLQIRDLAEELETFGLAATPIAGIAFGVLVLGTNLVDQFAKWCHRRLQRKQTEQADSFNLNSKPEEVRSCNI